VINFIEAIILTLDAVGCSESLGSLATSVFIQRFPSVELSSVWRAHRSVKASDIAGEKVFIR
jgi:hypothetical protein